MAKPLSRVQIAFSTQLVTVLQVSVMLAVRITTTWIDITCTHETQLVVEITGHGCSAVRPPVENAASRTESRLPCNKRHWHWHRVC
jgi:hypothetical protein